MRRSERESFSLWHAQEDRPYILPSLTESISADICVVGAGIAGLTTAYLLQKEGRNVVVVDAWGLASGETGRTTAHITAVLDDRFYNLEKLYGRENARLAADSHRSAINLIESIVQAEGISCDFERLDGYLVALSPEYEQDLKKEVIACRHAGFKDQEFLPHLSVTGKNIGPALRFPEQATFNISKYMYGLARAFESKGGRIYTDTRIVEVKEATGRTYAKTEEGASIDAEAIVIATNTPVNDWVKMHTKQAAYRSYVVAFAVPKNSYPPFLLWDMQDPYHYARIVRGNTEDYLVVGGEDHKTGQSNDAEIRYKKLQEWTNEVFSTSGSLLYQWSGQIMEPVDHLAFIGRNPGNENIYIISGDSGNGMTHGTLAGILLTDLIQGRTNPWESLYDPARKALLTTPTYIKENANFIGCMVSDWMAPSEARNEEDIPLGQGAVMRTGLSKQAVYKDENGTLHKCSAICTHLGCVVQWNGGEKSWDCPCHGSRFDPQGRILNGPAIKPLEERLSEKSHPRPEIQKGA